MSRRFRAALGDQNARCSRARIIRVCVLSAPLAVDLCRNPHQRSPRPRCIAQMRITSPAPQASPSGHNLAQMRIAPPVRKPLRPTASSRIRAERRARVIHPGKFVLCSHKCETICAFVRLESGGAGIVALSFDAYAPAWSDAKSAPPGKCRCRAGRMAQRARQSSGLVSSVSG